jgi:hypothetical protein
MPAGHTAHCCNALCCTASSHVSCYTVCVHKTAAAIFLQDAAVCCTKSSCLEMLLCQCLTCKSKYPESNKLLLVISPAAAPMAPSLRTSRRSSAQPTQLRTGDACQQPASHPWNCQLLWLKGSTLLLAWVWEAVETFASCGGQARQPAASSGASSTRHHFSVQTAHCCWERRQAASHRVTSTCNGCWLLYDVHVARADGMHMQEGVAVVCAACRCMISRSRCII